MGRRFRRGARAVGGFVAPSGDLRQRGRAAQPVADEPTADDRAGAADTAEAVDVDRFARGQGGVNRVEDGAHLGRCGRALVGNGAAVVGNGNASGHAQGNDLSGIGAQVVFVVFGQVDEGRHAGVEITAELARGRGRLLRAGVFAGQEATRGERGSGDPVGVGGGEGVQLIARQ